MARISFGYQHMESVRQTSTVSVEGYTETRQNHLEDRDSRGYRIFGCDIVPYPSEMNNEILSSEDVKHIARLAALRISDDEVDTMRSQLSDILAHFQTLAELDTAGVSPTGHTTDAHSVMRDDQEMPALDREQTLSNAPFVDGEFVRVRPVIE